MKIFFLRTLCVYIINYFFVFLCFFFLSTNFTFAQQTILEVATSNPPPSTIHLNGFPNGQWPKNVCGGDTWLVGSAPREWQSILDGDGPDNNSIVGVSGNIYNPHVSDRDVWFDHPFGFDYNFDIQWKSNPNFDFLVSPRVGADEDEDGARLDAQLKGYNGDIHIEMDSQFVPPAYRARAGDVAAVFGRWIVDCGHPNYQSEIHPPLMVVSARALPILKGSSYTQAKVISRPFMVEQSFSDGHSLRDYILFQSGEITGWEAIPFGVFFVAAFQYEAKPNILAKSFTGSHSMSFNIRPPQPALPNQHLFASYHFTTRTGVSVQLQDLADGQGTITVTILFDETKYIYPQLPPPTEETISVTTIKNWNSSLWNVLSAGEAGIINTNPFALDALEKGVKTNHYDIPIYSEQNDLKVSMNELRANGASGITLAGITENNNQVYPIRGSIKVEWDDIVPSPINNLCSGLPFIINSSPEKVDFMPNSFTKSQLVTINNISDKPIPIGKLFVDGQDGSRFLLQNKTIFLVHNGGQQPPEDISNTTIPAHGSAALRIAISNPIQQNLIATLHIIVQGCDLTVPLREYNSFIQ